MAIAAIAGITSGRVLQEAKSQQALESATSATQQAYAQMQLAINVVVGSAYNGDNDNVELRAAIQGANGGTVDDTWLAPPADPAWIDDSNDPVYGLLRGTDVRVYHARDYIARLDRLLGQDHGDVDATGLSDGYFILEATGRSAGSVEVIALLVRETQAFSSFVFFQNRGTLGVSGAPVGRIHANNKVAFYAAGGTYVDAVTAVAGFEYEAGATAENTNLRQANPNAKAIGFDGVDVGAMAAHANLFAGQTGHDARISLEADGSIRIDEYTKPQLTVETETYTTYEYVGTETDATAPMDSDEAAMGTPVYEEKTYTYEVETYTPPELVGTTTVTLGENEEGVIYVDGRITSLHGDLLGRLTIVSGDSVRITGDLHYIDADGDTAMSNGSDADQPYQRNADYDGGAMLGVIARQDVLYTRHMSGSSEINAMLMAVEGRVGIDGFWADVDDELVEDSPANRLSTLGAERTALENAYDMDTLTATTSFVHASLRRLGGVVSNESILETKIVAAPSDSDNGGATVFAGFEQGQARYDAGLGVNPPPSFAESRRPVIMSYLPLGRR